MGYATSKITFNVFLAGSRYVQDEKDAVRKFLSREYPSESNMDFTVREFSDDMQEAKPDSVQKYINERIKPCDIFILIVDGSVGQYSEWEFLQAFQLYKSGRKPYHLFIFSKNNPSECTDGGFQSTDKCIPFSQFREKYLEKSEFIGDRHVRSAVCHEVIYENIEDLVCKIKEQFSLISFQEPGMVMGGCVTGDDFYHNDMIRLEHCKASSYYSRRVDVELRDAMRDGTKYIYITGKPLSGKTRCVLQAVTEHKNDLFRLFPRDLANARDEMRRLSLYYKTIINPRRAYIVIDDVDRITECTEWNEGNTPPADAFGDLINAASRSDVTFIFTSSYRPSELNLGIMNIGNSKVIVIEPLTQMDFVSAHSYFVSADELLKPVLNAACCNEKCDTIGSMLIYCNDKTEGFPSFVRKYGTVYGSIGWSLIKSIKAMKIWHRRNSGNIDYLIRFSQFLLRKSGSDECPKEKLSSVLSELCDCYGITRVGENKIEVQDFVYRDVLSFSGTLRKGMSASAEQRAEYGAVNDILEYSMTHRPDRFMEDVAKVCMRSSHQNKVHKDVSSLIFEVWMGGSPGEFGETISWAEKLQEVKAGAEADSRDRVSDSLHRYIACLYRYAVLDSPSFKKALEIYRQTPVTDHMLFGALIQKAGVSDREGLMSLPDYEKFRSVPSCITRMGRLSASFDDALDLVKSYNEVCKKTDWSFSALTDLSNLVGNLLAQVTTYEEFDSALALVRKVYPVKERTTSGILPCGLSDLTMIDLLSLSSLSGIKAFADNFFGSDAGKMAEFLTERFTKAIPHTMANRFTGEQTIASISSVIGQSFLTNLRRAHVSYKVAEGSVFDNMCCSIEVEGGVRKSIGLRNSFVYCRLFDFIQCSYYKARDVLEKNVLSGDGADKQNVITSHVLNRLLLKAVNSADNESNMVAVHRLFHRFGIRYDVYFYNDILLAHREHWRKISADLEGMIKDNVIPDANTLKIIFSAAPSFTDSLFFLPSFFGDDVSALQSNVPGDVTIQIVERLKKCIPNFRNIIAADDDSWKQLFSKPCGKGQREFVKAALESLRTNTCYFRYYHLGLAGAVSNKTLFNSYEQSDKYISGLVDAGALSRDSIPLAVVSELLNRIDVQEQSAKSVMKKLFSLVKGCAKDEDNDWVTEIMPSVATKRLLLYRSQTQRINKWTPLEFLNDFTQRHQCFDSDMLTGFLEIREGMDASILDELSTLIKNFRTKITDAHRKTVSCYYAEIMSGDTRKIFRIGPSISDRDNNEAIINKIKRGEIESLSAVPSLMKGDGHELAKALTMALSCFVKRKKEADATSSSELFDQAVKFYSAVFRCSVHPDGLIPHEYTILALINAAGGIADLHEVVNLISGSGRGKIELLRDKALGNMLLLAKDLNDVQSLISLYETDDTNSRIETDDAEIIVHALAVLSKKDKNSRQVMDSLFDHILTSEGDVSSFAATVLRCRALRIYRDRKHADCVTSNLIHELLVYRQESFTGNVKIGIKYWEGLFDVIINLYPSTLRDGNTKIISLLNYPESRRGKDSRVPYIKLYSMCAQRNIPCNISYKSILVLSEYNYIRDYRVYCDLLISLSTCQLRVIDDAMADSFSKTLLALSSRSSCAKSHFDRIAAYSKADSLRAGFFHPDIDSLMKTTTRWACEILHAPGNVDLSIQNEDYCKLKGNPDAYILALKYLDKSKRINREIARCVSEYERECISTIAATDINNMHDVLRIPRYWESTLWKPNMDMRRKIVSEIISRCYVEYQSGNEKIKFFAGMVLRNVKCQLEYSESKGFKRCDISYKSINNKCRTDEKIRFDLWYIKQLLNPE